MKQTLKALGIAMLLLGFSPSGWSHSGTTDAHGCHIGNDGHKHCH